MAETTRKRAPGGGRKPKESTIARARLNEEKVSDAERAFALLVEWMDDNTLKEDFRKGCAVEVMDRVWGKPKQVVAGDANEPLKIVVEYIESDAD